MTKIARFQHNSRPTWGTLHDGGLRDLGGLDVCAGVEFKDVLGNWAEWHPRIVELETQAEHVVAPECWLSAVPEGGKILCIGLNYRDHAIESGMEIPSEPVVFNKLPGTLCGHQSVVQLPPTSNQVDYEAELVIVIGSSAWQVSEEDAMQHVFGYTGGHDVSARDWQLGRPGGQWLLGKSFPGFAPIGPAIVPASEVADVQNLRVRFSINGEVLQDSSTKQLIFSPAQIIAHLSKCCILEPGDVIFTGTPPGVGMARKPQRFIAPGDVCTVEVQDIGELTNTFVG